jgi:hypothetical protein
MFGRFAAFGRIPSNLDGLLPFSFPIPTGLKHQAQGWLVAPELCEGGRGASYPGGESRVITTLNGLYLCCKGYRSNPFVVATYNCYNPRVGPRAILSLPTSFLISNEFSFCAFHFVPSCEPSLVPRRHDSGVTNSRP